MTTQMLIYERAVPITVAKHKDTYVKAGNNFRFASKINAVPLMTTEFISAAKEFAVVFSGTEERVMPTVILGARNEENLFVDGGGNWDAGYRPAFLRQYPFVFAGSEGSDQLTLCLDEEFEGVNTDGKGERLFDAEGNRTAYLNLMLDFSQKYQGHFRRTEAFSARLKELDLLEPMQANFQLQNGQKISLAGFQAINRQKVKELDAETLKSLAQTDELELIYVHLQSMQNLDKMISRLNDIVGDEPEPTEADEVMQQPDLARSDAKAEKAEETEIS